MITWEAAGIGAYLLLQLAIGYWVSRFIKNEQDYFVAGKSLGIGLASFSIFATWFGAEACMSSASNIFQKGLAGSRADPFGYTICLFLASILLAGKLWKRNYITLADFYRDRYSKTVEILAIMILVPTSMLWAAAQIRAFGQVIAMTTEFDVNMAIGFATIFVIFYTFLGGMMGDVIHDLLQGTVIIIGLGILLFTAFDYFGGAGAALSKIEPARLKFIAPGESWLSRLDTWMIPVLGSLVAQELIARILACKTAKTATNAGFVASGIYLVVGLMPVTLGLLGPYFDIQLEHNDQFLPSLAKHLLSLPLFILFTGALVAAVLATTDSTLLSVSALVSHNLLSENMKSKLDGKKKLLMGRLVVTGAAIIAYFMAISADNIFELVQAAASFGTGGLVVITLIGLWSKFGGKEAACSALVTGIAINIISFFVDMEAPFITSMVMSALVYVGVQSKSYIGKLKLKLR